MPSTGLNISLPRILMGNCPRKAMAVPVPEHWIGLGVESDPFNNMQILAAKKGIGEIPAATVQFWLEHPIFRFNFSEDNLRDIGEDRLVMVGRKEVSELINQPKEIPEVLCFGLAHFLPDSTPETRQKAAEAYYRSQMLYKFVNNLRGYLPGGESYRADLYKGMGNFDQVFNIIDAAIQIEMHKSGYNPHYRQAVENRGWVMRPRDFLGILTSETCDIGEQSRTLEVLDFSRVFLDGQKIFRFELIDEHYQSLLPLINTILELASRQGLSHKDFGLVI